MNTRKMSLAVVLVAMGAVVMVGCGNKGGSTAPQQSSGTNVVSYVPTETGQSEGRTVVSSGAAYPKHVMDAINAGREGKLKGTIYVVGMGESKDDILAKRSSSAQADVQIAAFFEQRVGEIYKEFRGDVNDETERLLEQGIKTIVLQNIRGVLELQEAAFKEVYSDGAVKYYTVKYIALSSLINAMNDAIKELERNNPNQNIATRARASRTFQEIDDAWSRREVLDATR